ncbi:lipoprotein signal peptidase [Aliidongia dinghuensis]|uniref:Lipoprotein signal peptidase n=1 Tax=Aliidongia dinghuensis TaxID=1867774 RepID=A0A8J2YTK2_9PROT|nr:signal peptidase II [Aliidongia dinghuensis]GGF16941.1 lipoprotein signal peptidase [Aliidongia dinghuensis]
MMRTGLRWLWLTVLVVVLDQVSKLLLIEQLQPFQPVRVLPSLNFLLTYNTGVSFSFLQLPGGWQRWPLAIFAIVIAAVLIGWLARIPAARRLLGAAVAIILGGAVGNLIDRILRGQVTDFIQFYVGDWSFAIFNIADAAITVGVALILLDNLLGGDGRSRQSA